MTITPLQMYGLITLDSVGTIFVILAVFFGVLGFFVLWNMVTMYYTGEDISVAWRKTRKYVFVFSFCGVFFMVCAALLPSTKQAAAIIVLPKIINNQRVQEIPDNVLSLGLDWLEELKPKKE